MKRVLYITVTAAEALCLAGAYAVQYFTRRKMGMARYVVYKNRGWEAAYPMELITRGIWLALAVLAVSVFIFFLKRRKGAAVTLWLMNAVMVMLAAGSAGFVLLNSTENFRAYYFISGILGAASLLQTVKTFAGTWVCRHEI